MDNLAAMVKEAVFSYVGGGFNLKLFALSNEEKQVYAVNVIDTPIRKQAAGVVLLARIVDDYVVIEEDTTDRPLMELLIYRGIPRERIVLAYAGETLPEVHPEQVEV